VADLVIGFDVGGTGARGILAQITQDGAVPVAHAARATALRKGPRGVDGAATAAVLTTLAAHLLAAHRQGGRTVAVAVGCAGAATFGDDLRAHLPDALARATGARTVLLCSDMITAFFGALAGEPGVVLAVGTGAVAVGSDLAHGWRRVDGWGHVVGDLGGGAWIGRAGLVAALRAYDGRGPASPRLLAELRQRFTDPPTLIRDLYGREDQAAVLASFAPAVLAARPPSVPAGIARMTVAVTGALLDSHDQFRVELIAALADEMDVRPAAGTSCDGALRLAQAVAKNRLQPAVMDQITLHHPATG
jgi:N-acetylglucosamine kinase-like BadF-type ATPase